MGFKKVSGRVTLQFLSHFFFFFVLYVEGAVGQEEVGVGVVYKVRSEGHCGPGRSAAPPAVCLSWSVCGCVAGLQPFLFSDVCHLGMKSICPDIVLPSFSPPSACCKTKPCADLSPKDPAHSLFFHSSSGVQHHPKPRAFLKPFMICGLYKCLLLLSVTALIL